MTIYIVPNGVIKMRVGVARPVTQVAIFLLFFIVPLLVLFRMDLMQLRFYVLRKEPEHLSC